MKLNPKFLTHVTKGEHYMISTSDTKFKGIVKNNETAAFIVECLKADTTESTIVDKLLAEYLRFSFFFFFISRHGDENKSAGACYLSPADYSINITN